MEDFECYEGFRYVEECNVRALVNQGPDITYSFCSQVDPFDGAGQVGTYVRDGFSAQICAGQDDIL